MAPFRSGEVAAPDQATPLPPSSIEPLRRQELTGAWRVMETAGRPPYPRARSVIQGVVENDGYALVFSALSSFRLTYSKPKHLGISAN
jgi:hypothetical protein